jgi:cell division protein FtsI/penicillin-binding protein 2
MNKRGRFYFKPNIKEINNKRFNVITFFIIISFSFLSLFLIIVQVGEEHEYKSKLTKATEKIVSSNSVPRGRIYDRNYNILVDNVGKKTIYYKKPKGVKVSEEIDLAYKMVDIIDVSYNKLYKINLKEFWLVNNQELGNKKVTNEEYKKYSERKLSSTDLKKLKLERITDEELNAYNERDKEAAYIYYLMNKGYSYDEKIIKDVDVTDKEYAYISENANLYNGFNTKLEWERYYPYGDVLKGVLGSISDSSRGIPYELKASYLKNGYALNDRVGLSNLEYQYENLLKGVKSIYKINSDNSKELLHHGVRGNDIVLSIDINLQLTVENIIKEEMIKAKKETNTEYYNKSFVIISNPNNGEILAYAAKQIAFKDGEYVFYDYTPYISTTTVTVGSVIKGASMSVGYNTGAISIGTRMLDECIKLKNTPAKCSWTNGLGMLDDIRALQVSSNSYQFKIAMKVGKANYRYNTALVIDPKAFDAYRNTFAEFGLGVKTGIDLPLEGTGYKGDNTVSGHLLDFAIGQYDTYTPLQLIQYINTIASGGKRIGLHFLKEIHGETLTNEIGPLESVYEPKIYNTLNMEQKYIDRIRYGFSMVMSPGGLGKGYMGNVPSPAGKTGTSQSFIDSDGDGKIDKETISNTFAGYFPSTNPIMSIISISPDVSHIYTNSTYRTMINKRITSKISEKFFDIYK